MRPAASTLVPARAGSRQTPVTGSHTAPAGPAVEFSTGVAIDRRSIFSSKCICWITPHTGENADRVTERQRRERREKSSRADQYAVYCTQQTRLVRVFGSLEKRHLGNGERGCNLCGIITVGSVTVSFHVFLSGDWSAGRCLRRVLFGLRTHTRTPIGGLDTGYEPDGKMSPHHIPPPNSRRLFGVPLLEEIHTNSAFRTIEYGLPAVLGEFGQGNAVESE